MGGHEELWRNIRCRPFVRKSVMQGARMYTRWRRVSCFSKCARTRKCSTKSSSRLGSLMEVSALEDPVVFKSQRHIVEWIVLFIMNEVTLWSSNDYFSSYFRDYICFLIVYFFKGRIQNQNMTTDRLTLLCLYGLSKILVEQNYANWNGVRQVIKDAIRRGNSVAVSTTTIDTIKEDTLIRFHAPRQLNANYRTARRHI